jgi:hypothetical protein
MNGIPAENVNTEAGAPAEAPTPAKKPRSAAPKAHVASSKARPGKKATPANPDFSPAIGKRPSFMA